MIHHSFPKRFLILVWLFLPLGAFASDKSINTTVFGHLALHGYDPVAYFTDHKAIEGSKAFTLEHGGGTYRFASDDHLKLFQANPEKYTPQYGGYCAYAVSQGHTADIDPEAWRIVNDKLYLNYSKKIQTKWEQDQQHYINDADKNWPAVSQGK